MPIKYLEKIKREKQTGSASPACDRQAGGCRDSGPEGGGTRREERDVIGCRTADGVCAFLFVFVCWMGEEEDFKASVPQKMGGGGSITGCACAQRVYTAVSLD